MILTTNQSIYTINSYSNGLTQVSFDLEGNANDLKLDFLGVTEATISNDEDGSIASFSNLSFKSITAYADSRVTVTMTFPEVSTLSSQISDIQKNLRELDEMLAEIMYGGI